mgnify:CR=1 FL=1
MPELPDVELYVERLGPLILGQPLEALRLASPFLLRTAEPPWQSAQGRRVTALRRVGKRIAWELEGELWVVIHLMIAGRLRWRPAGAAIPARRGLCAFDFPTGTLLLTEEGTKKRAALHLLQGQAALAAHDPGGLEPLVCTLGEFSAALTRERHTLKRSLTDPRLFSGIGNAYSDEILHRARLSPLQLTTNLDPPALERLFQATRAVLQEWLDCLRQETPPGGFPEQVTAFREGMAVHGRHGEPCPVCGSPVQRIRYAENECNYCATCQTGGRLLADRGLSRLLKEDWPRTLEELEALRKSPPPPASPAPTPRASRAKPRRPRRS